MGYRNIGTISRTHGTSGAMILTQCPDTSIKIKPGTQVLIGFSASFSKPYTLTSCETYKQSLIITLHNVGMNDISDLKDNGVFIEETALLRSDDNYFISDLIGCSGIDEQGNILGTITDVWIMPANDVWVLSMPEGDIPLPVIDDVIRSVDIQKKQIVIRLIEGLRDLLPKSSNDSQLD
ncbi:MAG: ribosome maturation factor RimM [Ignavibacteria bacterium]|jgi:16S rRNA processing protein RimM|nr:ribosome maturation factor RimM [Chlorobiota bacterium]